MKQFRSEMSQQSPRANYRWTLLLGGSLMLLVIAAYGWVSVASGRRALTNDLRVQGEQVAGALNDKLDVVRSHVVAMRRSTEHSLANPELANTSQWNTLLRRSHGVYADAPWESLPKALQSEVGSVFIASTSIDARAFQRDVAALATVFPATAATHESHRKIQRSFYWDAQQRWWWTYPAVARDVKPNTPAPQKALQNTLDWSPPYPGAAGSGLMATLRAPVYLQEQYLGTVGTEVALAMLETVLEQHPLRAARALVVDSAGVLLADSQHTLRNAVGTLQLSDVVPGAPASILHDSPRWLHFPLRGTSWVLLLYVPDSAVRAHLLEVLRPFVSMAMLLVLGLLGLAWIQNHRIVRPALQLSDYVDQAAADANAEPPSVPRAWTDRFRQVQRTANDQRDRMETVVQRARQLEQSLKQRTQTLQALQKNALPKGE